MGQSLGHLKVGYKLALLMGVPVVGAILLSILIARDAQVRSESAAALGSIEDLAELTHAMTRVAHQLQRERAEIAYSVGAQTPFPETLAAEKSETDGAL
ncbi:MAG: hypothetical protein ABW133_10680, partial [Polyangiaceae bacterium]